MANYSIEIWNKAGNPIADIRQICTNFKWSKTLNGSETVSFDIDLFRLEKLIASLGLEIEPFEFFEVGRSDVRIKREGKYIIGCNAYSFNYTTSDPTITCTVNCVGYLNYYKTRYITAKYSQMAQQDILWDVIDRCNQMNGGDYGVRKGTHTGANVVRDRTYERKEVASLIQQMSNVINGCDFDFSPDKHFNTYEAKGTYRPSIHLTYPGSIQTFSIERSIEKVANFVYGIGSGNGEDAIQSTAEDIYSEDYVYRREKIATWNSVSVQSTLDEHTNATLHYLSDIIEIPVVTLRPGTLDLSEVDVGDTIDLEIKSSLTLEHVRGSYRIEKIDCSVDDNDSETVQLTFDNLDIDEIIPSQDEEEE